MENNNKNHKEIPMRSLTLSALLVLMLGSQPAWSNPIFYEVENLGGDAWQYTYTAGNETAGPIDWFTIFFDFDLYSFNLISGPFGDEVDPASYDGPADWDIFVAPPELLFPGSADNQPGFFDAFALELPIGPGGLVGGFDMTFEWLGVGMPGAQPFTLFGDDLLPTFGDNLFTQPLQVTSVPEPGALLLLGTGLFLMFGRRHFGAKLNGRSSI